MRNAVLIAVLAFAGTLQNAGNGSLRGTISASGSDEGIAGVRVEMGPFSAQTASDGRFAIENITPGEYTLKVIRDGYLLAGKASERSSLSASVISASSTTAGSIRIGSGQNLDNVHLEMVREGAISGRVLTPDGLPAADASIYLSQVFYREGNRSLMQFVRPGMGRTNDRGEFRLWGLPIGEYYMTASLRTGWPPGPAFKAYYPSATNPAGAQSIRIGAGEQIVNADIQLQELQTTAVSVSVGAASDTATISQLVYMTTPRGSDPALQTMGWLEVGGLPLPGGRGIPAMKLPFTAPGTYTVFAAARKGGANYFGEVEVDTAKDSVREVTLAFRPSVDIEGVVTLSPNAPGFTMKAAPIELLPLADLEYFAFLSFDRRSSTSVVGPDGAFTMKSISEGAYAVVPTLPSGYYLADVRQGDRSILSSGLRVSVDNLQRLEVVVSGNGGILEGFLQNSMGGTLAFSRVVLIPDPPNRSNFGAYRTVSSDHYGRFQFRDVAPGGYQVFAWANVPDGAWTNGAFMMRYEGRGTPIRVSSGERAASAHVVQITD